MNIIIICEERFRDYIVSIFEKHNKIMKLCCFVAWQGEDYGSCYNGETSYKGYPVLKFDQIKEMIYDHFLVAGQNTGYLSQIERAMHDNGVDNVLAIRWFSLATEADFIDNNDFDMKHIIRLSSNNEKPWLGELQVHVTDSCNLNCKACTHFTPFVKGRRPMDLERFESDIIQLSKIFTNIFLFHIMGGEPLLEPDLCMRMIDVVRKYFPDTSINLITNGSLVNKMDECFWKHLHDNCVTVRVSLYPAVIKSANEIQETLKRYDITYFCEVLNKIEFDKYFLCKHTSDPLYNMQRCHGRGCYSLYYGKIAKCPSPLYAKDVVKELENVGITGDWLYAKDAIDIYNDQNAWEILRKLEQPCDFCSHCDIDNKESISWEMVKGEPSLADWFIDYGD